MLIGSPVVLSSIARRVAASAFALAASHAGAVADPLSGVAQRGSAAVGLLPRAEHSPYRGAGTRFDLVPIYLFEGERFYLHSLSLGVRLGAANGRRIEVFLRNRLEGHPSDDIPASLAGMAPREPGIDAGVGAHVAGRWGTAYVEALGDVSDASGGAELRLGYAYPARRGRWHLRPYAYAAWRNARLNDYYYGVRPEEARADRPSYAPGAGISPQAGVQAVYRLTAHWRLLAATSLAFLPDEVRRSPIVDERTVRSVQIGLLYEASPANQVWAKPRPLVLRALYGASTDCDVLAAATLRCTTTHTQDNTSIAGFEVGWPLIDRLNGWPVDIAGFAGVTQHKERGLQPDFPEIKAYIKAYFYGFPWDARIRTRLGLGVGLSYAKEIPFSERRDLAARGRNTSHLLNTLDPTVDFSLGDLLRAGRLRETYVGAGVSHRSGIFGTSQLLGNVNGGSNYLYGYVESSF